MRWTWQYLGLLVLVVVVLYAPHVQNGFLYEDQAMLKSLSERLDKAGVIRTAAGVSSEGYWRPVSRLTLLVQKTLGGVQNPVPFRLFNVGLIALIALAAYGMMRTPALGIRRMAACLAALILTAHPVASAAVYRIGDGREILLALLFSLGSVALYLRATWWGTAGAMVCCALALGSSEQAVWLPLVLLAAEVAGLPGRDGHEDESGQGLAHLTVVREKERIVVKWSRAVPVFLVAALYLAVRGVVLGGFRPDGMVGDRMPFFAWVYAWQVLVAPTREVVFQPALSVWLTGWRFMVGVGFFGLVALAVVLAIRHSGSAGRERKGLALRRGLFWGAWLLATRLAVMGILTGGPVFDEGQELPFSVAVWGVLAWSLSGIWELDWVRREIVVFGACAVVVLAAISLGRRDYYRDDETFASQWARANPEAWRGYASRAQAWEGAGRLEAAGRLVERGLMLQPDALELMLRQASILEKSGRVEDALLTFQKIAASNPTNWDTREKVADLTFKLGRFREASDLFLVLADALPEKTEIKVKLEAARKAELGASP